MRVLKSARIVFNGGYASADCRVKNLSLSGALLEMPSTVGIPTQFELHLDGSMRSCTVTWRSDRFIGVAFNQRGVVAVADISKSTPSGELATEQVSLGRSRPRVGGGC
jgi:hypothetical protein